MNPFAKFFLFCSGAHPSLLKRTPTDRNKYLSLGGTIFFTGLLAGIACGYALYTVFESYIISIVFGAIWGLMIFNLDRYIILSMKIKKGIANTLGQAIPRIALAVIIAMVIAKPIELKLFESEINSELEVIQQERLSANEALIRKRYEPELAALELKEKQWNARIDSANMQFQSLAQAALVEADGTGGSMKRNMGPIYKAKKMEADKAENNFKTLEAAASLQLGDIYTNRQRIELAKTEDIARLDRDQKFGIASRLNALSRISATNSAIKYASLFIMLLFIALECTPIFSKLISRNSPYDYRLDGHEYHFETQHRYEIERLDKEADRKTESLSMVN